MDVQEYLEERNVSFQVIPHEQAFTAQEVAAEEHVSGHKFAKTVIATGPADACYMFVLPASRHVDFEKASEIVGEELELASEERMKELFPDCEIGAEPPFGSEYGVPTYMDEALNEFDEIVFRAGTHDLTLQVALEDYKKLEDPQVAQFAILED